MGRNGSGIRKSSETSYEITFTYQGVRCRERIKLKPSPTNERRVANHLGAILDSIDKGTFDYAVTFPKSTRKVLFVSHQSQVKLIEEYLDEWLTAKSKVVKASTEQGYTKIINNLIIPKFKGKVLADIKRPDIRKWLAEMNCSNKRLSNIQSVFRTAMQDAVDDELLEVNPLYGWKYENKQAPKIEDDVDPFSEAEQSLILSELSGQDRNIFQFFFWTGLRPSELVALQWDDIDWQRGTISVTKSLTQAAIEFEEPKTKAGNRDVKILAPALEALTNQKQHTYLANKHIFTNSRTGEPISGDQVLRKTVWQPALKRAKVKYRRPYQTRHTYASMMLTAGESISWLAQQMGHADFASIRKTYGRFIKDSIPDAGEKAVQMFTKNAGINAGIKVDLPPQTAHK
jgi:integrase